MSLGPSRFISTLCLLGLICGPLGFIEPNYKDGGPINSVVGLDNWTSSSSSFLFTQIGELSGQAQM